MEVRFDSLADVDQFVAQHGRDQLRRLLMEASIHPQNRRCAEVWFWEQSEKDRERSTAAAETAATASRESATASHDAARWTRWSALIATVALIVSAWPFVKDIGRPTVAASTACAPLAQEHPSR